MTTKSVGGGLHTSALGSVPSSCTGGLTGDTISVCTSGKKEGEFCAANADCTDGKLKCSGGTDSTKNCHTDDDCEKVCTPFNGHCEGGGSPDVGCDSDADCTTVGATCKLDGAKVCGTFNGLCESSDSFYDGQACNADADCGGGQCKKVKFGVCLGGKHNGKKCKDTKHCQSGKGGSGVCSNEATTDAGIAPVDPCDPFCNILSDTAEGLDAGTGFLLVDGGLTTMGCGDGVVVSPEACDDKNTVSGDGCSSSCTLEPGYYCPTPGSPCLPATCGNGIVEGLEQCDDTTGGNPDRPYDGCFKCQFEVQCPPGGPCTQRCGDGVVMGTETCDDGNTIDGDGCDSTCTPESGASCTTSTSTLTPTIDVPVIYRDFVGFNQQAGSFPATVTYHPDFQMPKAPHASIAGYTGYPCVSGEQNSTFTHTGIMNDTLGADGLPYARSPVTVNKNECSVASIYQWYHDTPSVNKVILGKYIRLAQQGGPMGTAYLFDAANDMETTPLYNCGSAAAAPNNHCKGLGGFWPINSDGFGPFLPTYTIKNFHFTSEVRIPFTYKGGEKLDFNGDDDVFVYVAGRKVVDLGGIHGATPGTVTLANSMTTTPPDNNAFTLTPGKTYEIAVFQAERNTIGSNYKLTLQGFTRQRTTCTKSPPPQTFIRDYQAVCKAGTRVQWQVFRWKGLVTSATQNVAFTAATAETQAALPASATDASTVAIGTATNTNTVATAWAYQPCAAQPCEPSVTPTPVSAILKADGQTSQSWLRVFMTFNGTPTLTEWQMIYDCVDAE